jgi:hypothetical protein
MGFTLFKKLFKPIMALDGQRHVFMRTSRLMHLIVTEPAEGERSFEFARGDAHVREAIMSSWAHAMRRYKCCITRATTGSAGSAASGANRTAVPLSKLAVNR